MFEGIGASYPQEFFYNISKLNGSMSKQLVKVSADRPDKIAPGQIVNFRLPIGALLNLESLNIWFQVTLAGEKTLPARYASSFIKRMSIQINNVSAQILNEYAFTYNFYADHNNKSLTKTIAGDWNDNSILWTHTAPCVCHRIFN